MKLDFIVDTGSCVNVISRDMYNRFNALMKLTKTNTNIYTYGSAKPLQIHGKFQTTVESKSNFALADFYVVNSKGDSLIIRP